MTKGENRVMSVDGPQSNSTMRAGGTIEAKSWDEKAYHEMEGGQKLSRASVTNEFRGDIEGEGTLEYLMTYVDERSGSFIGLERVVGRLGDRSGSFVLQHSGTFEGGIVKATWFVVPGSGTGDLSGLRGDGGFVAMHGENLTRFTLDYDLPEDSDGGGVSQQEPIRTDV
jgi:hypothetical protein